MALEQLHSVLSVKRKGIWTKTYEALMKKHLELCVDLKDHLTAKDGLHQYRNLCQTVSYLLYVHTFLFPRNKCVNRKSVSSYRSIQTPSKL